MIIAVRRKGHKRRARQHAAAQGVGMIRGLVAIGPLLVMLAWSPGACGQNPPTWGDESNPSPTAGSGVSQRANAAADKALDKGVEYPNASKPGPKLIVIPGEIKSNNASFTQKVSSNNIADFAELELTKANFQVLDRADLGPALNEIQLAYSTGDPDEAQKVMKKGALKTTKWIVRFDILKAEQVATQTGGFNGGVASNLIGILGNNSQAANVAGTVTGSVATGSGASVWIIGMRYKIIDASTTEQVATGYNELKMEVGGKATSVAGVSSGASGGVSLDTMVQRLVQRSVWDIDTKNK
jgi:hypothetical protein